MADINNINETPDYTASFDPNDVQQNRLMGALAYLGILILVPLFAAKESPFARFHCNQGLILIIAEVVVNILYRIFKNVPVIGLIIAIVEIALFVLAILGIINAAKGKAKELPLIGGIQILK